MTINDKIKVPATAFLFLYQRGYSIFRYGSALTAQLLAGSLILIFALAHFAGAQESVTIHVATNGLDKNAGTVESPVATMPKAIKLAERQPVPAEIVVHGGTYFLTNTVIIRHCSANKDRKLVIRSAENETPIFDGSIMVDKIEPLAGAPGVYMIKGEFKSDEPPTIWENDTGIRFVKLASLDSVKHKDYSSVVLDPQTLALRYKDGLSPANIGIRTSQSGVRYGFHIYRDNVTVRGIEFRNFCLGTASSAIMIGEILVRVKADGKSANREGVLTTNTVIDSCSTYNCHKGFWIYVGSSNAVITHCRVRNSITGIWVSGVDPIIENCTIVNDPDWLLVKARIQPGEQNGVRMYNYCTRATVRNNLIKGFRLGIHCKNGWGAFFIENNTVLYGLPRVEGWAAAMRPNMKNDYHVRRNIFVGFSQPFSDAGAIPPDADIDYNVFWGPEYNVAGTIAGFQKKGVGLHNVYADPLFASPPGDDYRLLSGSPALNIHDGRIAGAFPQVPADYKGVPNLRAALVHKSGAQTRDPFPPRQLPPFASYLSSQRDIAVNLEVSSIAPVEKTRFKVNDGPMQDRNFKATDMFNLPNQDGLHTLRFQVRAANSEWSEESVVYVTLRRNGVQLIGEPRVVTSRYGALCSFKADRYAWGKLEYHDGNKWIESANSKGLPQNSDGFQEDYGEYREFSSLPLLVAGLAPDTPQRYRLTVTTPLDSIVKEGAFTLNGKPKIMYVATVGEDSEAGGSREKPFRTLQFAFDRALPGDRVRILPGVYFGAHILNHGGTKEHPIVIEGLYPNTVTLDGLWEVATCLRLDNAPHVVLRNVNFRWFTGVVSVNDSEKVRVTGCRFYNQYWQTGSGCSGTGILFWRSPDFMVDHCIFTRFHYAGLVFDESSGGQVLHNTATACATALIQWRCWWRPSENITIQYNSLNYNADQMLSIQQPLDILRNKCLIDYNNYGTTFKRVEGTLAGKSGKYGRSVPKPFPYLPSNRELQYYRDTTDLSNQVTYVFVNMEDWQQFSGQDKHSIFADPKWIDPQAGRFDVAADSPNLLPDGKIIGALGYLGENPNMEPAVVVTAPYSGEEIKDAFAVTADASDYDGKVEKVEFYADDKKIGEAVTPPYQITGVKLSQGCHAITARAIDDKGAAAVSDEVRVTVNSGGGLHNRLKK